MTGWKAIAIGLVAAPLVVGLILVGADALGLRASSAGSTASTPSTGSTSGQGAGSEPDRARPAPAGGDAPAAAGSSVPTTTTTTPGGSAVGGPSPHTRATTAGAGPSGWASPSTTTTTTPAPTTTTAPAAAGGGGVPTASPVAAWRAQYGATLTTLQADVAAVGSAAPSASGDYTALVAPWRQLAADAAAAQALSAIPDVTVQATWSAALAELSTATTDWLASLSSTTPPGGPISDQAMFAAGSAQFTQGTADLTSVVTAVTAG